MAKFGQKLVDEIVDDDPGKGPPPAPAAQVSPLRTAAVGPDKFPWGYLVKHPSFGSFRVRRDQAKDEQEAIEVYRKKKCPFMSMTQLTETGLRVGATAFQPAATERGK